MITGRDRPAFDTFVASSSSRLLRTAYLLCGDRGHAEDLVQTALMRTARQWRRARDHPELYARRVVVNLATDRWRERSRRPVEAPLDIDLPAREVGSIEERDAILRAAHGLSLGQRTVLVLRYFDDLSIEETAAAMGCTTGTVKSQTARALDNLRAALTIAEENAHADR